MLVGSSAFYQNYTTRSPPAPAQEKWDHLSVIDELLLRLSLPLPLPGIGCVAFVVA